MRNAGPISDHLSIGSWDDLRVALAIAREGSIRRAARSLGVSHSTILRRVDALEGATGVQLFERLPTGWALTAAGQDVFDSARELETIVVALERRVEGRDLRLAGPVRVTLPDALLPVLSEDLAAVARALPDVELTVAVSTGFANLGQREADIAIRVAPNPPPDLVGRRIGTLSCGVWGTEAYLRGRSTRDLASLDWVGWAREVTVGFARWLDTEVPNARVTMRVDTAWALREAIDAHAGVAPIPCPLGIARGWRRVRKTPELNAPLWVLTHADLRTMARVRAARDLLIEALVAKRPMIEGKLR
ncbi:MAG: LysR family transcriptional regulator [Sandaracinaceae bacterium]|nr:LysR family transcriptional regulator [Sandaracinaceae bacterium]